MLAATPSGELAETVSWKRYVNYSEPYPEQRLRRRRSTRRKLRPHWTPPRPACSSVLVRMFGLNSRPIEGQAL